jgi:hypothetical protein
MPQLHSPMFPSGVTLITDVLAFGKHDGGVTYFSGQLPVFSHAEDDVASFRMIASRFCVQGCARQSDIIRAFGMASIGVKRSVKTYRKNVNRRVWYLIRRGARLARAPGPPAWMADKHQTVPLPSRPAHRPFRGLLIAHSRCGLRTRTVTYT